MLSHDFAKLLLSCRNNDLRFNVEVNAVGHDDEDGDWCRTKLADDRAREVYGMDEDVEILKYSSEDDMLDVFLGPVFAGKVGEYTLSAEEVRLISGLLKDAEARGAIDRNPATDALRRSIIAALA